MRWTGRLAAGLLVTLAVTAGGHWIADQTDAAGGDVLGPGQVTVEVGIEHSRFSVDELRVRPGTLVRFVIDNADPIDHEFVVGDQDVHDEHAHGTERAHPPVPGEVSVAPGERASTVYRFDDVGPVAFACHLPGHVAYGMIGTVDVVAG